MRQMEGENMDSQNQTEPVHPDIGSPIPEKAGNVSHTEDERFLREYKQSKKRADCLYCGDCVVNFGVHCLVLYRTVLD